MSTEKVEQREPDRVGLVLAWADLMAGRVCMMLLAPDDSLLACVTMTPTLSAQLVSVLRSATNEATAAQDGPLN